MNGVRLPLLALLVLIVSCSSADKADPFAGQDTGGPSWADVEDDAATTTPDGGASDPDTGGPAVPAPDRSDFREPLDLRELSPQPLGGVCGAAGHCETGECLTDQPGGYCTRACDRDEDCPSSGACLPAPGGREDVCWATCRRDEECRADQYCANRVCVQQCAVGSCKRGYLCDLESGRCVEATDACQPRDERCDDVDNDCDGVMDEGCGEIPDVPTSVRVESLGWVWAGEGVTRDIAFDIPAGASSFAVIVVSRDDEDVVAWSLADPAGALLVDPADWRGSQNPTVPQPGTYTLLVPNSPRVRVKPGTYALRLFKQGARARVDVYLAINGTPTPTQGRLDLDIWFVDVPELDAAAAQDDERFQAMVDRLDGILEQAGVRLGDVTYRDLTSADAERLSVVDPRAGEDRALLRHADGGALDLFFVQGFADGSVPAMAGGTPGPPWLAGTSASGVIVSSGDFRSYPTWGHEWTAQATAHVIGHQLGLFHTTEPDGSVSDPLKDTPTCTDDGDGSISQEECAAADGDNLMFWSMGGGIFLSDEQSWVIVRNPQVH